MKPYAALVSIVLLAACGESSDRQEAISKLRGLGASALPLVSPASREGEDARKVELTLYAALPEGHTVDIRPFKDQESSFAVMLEESQMEVQTDSIHYESYPGFQILTFKADLTVPTESFFLPFGGAGQVRYGFTLNDGDEVEKIIGNFMVYPENAPELAWQHPAVTIDDPLSGSTIHADADVDIAARLDNVNDEELTLGWFASSGEIKNRRAKETSWKAGAVGPQTLIITVHGKQSRGFAWQIVTVHAE